MTTRQTITAMLALAALTSACATRTIYTESAAGEVSPAVSIPTAAELDAAYMDATMSANARVDVLDSRAALIDARLYGPDAISGLAMLSRRDIELDPDAFSDITDERWARMEAWYEGSDIRKIRMIPSEDRNETEEFYYDRGNLIMVYWNPKGISAQDKSASSGGESFYFGKEGLLSWVRDDGTIGEPSSDEFKYWDAHLRKEAARFPNGRLNHR
jgi:hypothetical protein